MKELRKFVIKPFTSKSSLKLSNRLCIGKTTWLLQKRLFSFLILVLTLCVSCKEIKINSEKQLKSENITRFTDSTKKYEEDYSADSIQDTIRVSREKVISYLKKMHLIKDTKNYKIKLTNEELYIDGKKQLDSIHFHIIKNFVRHPRKFLSITYSISTD